jgi:hypothetical protein
MAANVTDAASCDPYAREAKEPKINAQIAKWTSLAFLPMGMRRFVTAIDNRTPVQ